MKNLTYILVLFILACEPTEVDESSVSSDGLSSSNSNENSNLTCTSAKKPLIAAAADLLPFQAVTFSEDPISIFHQKDSIWVVASYIGFQDKGSSLQLSVDTSLYKGRVNLGDSLSIQYLDCSL